MQEASIEASRPSLSTDAIARKIALFERLFRPEATEELKAQLGDRFQPEREISLDEISQKYSYYLDLVVEHPDLTRFVDRYLDQLHPYCQSPFLLPGNRVIQGPWLGEYKLGNFPLCGVNAESVANKRVLDIGCNAGFDTFYLATLGPSEVIGVEPAPLFYYQGLFLWTLYNAPHVRFVNSGWQSIRKDAFGTFDLINCQGVLYHEPSPMLLLEYLFDMLAPEGKLVLETHVTMNDDMKALFVEGAFWGDYNWFWIPSSNATCAMLRACGFQEVQMHAQYGVPSKNPDSADLTQEGVPVGGRAFFTARHPAEQRVFRIKYGWS